MVGTWVSHGRSGWRKRAQSMIEFVLVLPVFVALVALIVDGAQMLYAKGMTYYGAYTAARAASVQPSYPAGANAAQVGVQNMPAIFGASNPRIELTTLGGWYKGGVEQATATMTVHLFVPLPDSSIQLQSRVNVSSKMNMMIENHS